MSKIQLFGSTLLAGALACCSPTPNNTAVGCQPPLKVHTHGIVSTAMGPCPNNVAPTPDVVVRVVIPDNFSITTVQRKVKYIKPVTGENEGNIDDLGDTAYGAPLYSKTNSPFHVDLTQTTGIPKSGWAEIRIILRDNNLHFPKPPLTDSNNNVINGVALGEAGNPLGMCDANTYTSKKYSEAVFFVPLQTPNLKSNVGPYNILLSTDNAVDTPISIDPEVGNNG